MPMVLTIPIKHAYNQAPPPGASFFKCLGFTAHGLMNVSPRSMDICFCSKRRGASNFIGASVLKYVFTRLSYLFAYLWFLDHFRPLPSGFLLCCISFSISHDPTFSPSFSRWQSGLDRNSCALVPLQLDKSIDPWRGDASWPPGKLPGGESAITIPTVILSLKEHATKPDILQEFTPAYPISLQSHLGAVWGMLSPGHWFSNSHTHHITWRTCHPQIVEHAHPHFWFSISREEA